MTFVAGAGLEQQVLVKSAARCLHRGLVAWPTEHLCSSRRRHPKVHRSLMASSPLAAAQRLSCGHGPRSAVWTKRSSADVFASTKPQWPPREPPSRKRAQFGPAWTWWRWTFGDFLILNRPAGSCLPGGRPLLGSSLWLSSTDESSRRLERGEKVPLFEDIQQLPGRTGQRPCCSPSNGQPRYWPGQQSDLRPPPENRRR